MFSFFNGFYRNSEGNRIELRNKIYVRVVIFVLENVGCWSIDILYKERKK